MLPMPEILDVTEVANINIIGVVPDGASSVIRIDDFREGHGIEIHPTLMSHGYKSTVEGGVYSAVLVVNNKKVEFVLDKSIDLTDWVLAMVEASST